jgi:hypothetical protein
MLRIFEPDLAGVLEHHRGFYVADADHGWRLDCDVDEVVRGLKSALADERRRNRAMANALRSRGVTDPELKEITARPDLTSRLSGCVSRSQPGGMPASNDRGRMIVEVRGRSN